MSGKILCGDVLEMLKTIPDESIDCEITSPPYWGLRDYGESGQWGLEQDFRDYLKNMKIFMSEMKRVLKPTGTCWINLGDTYCGGGGKANEQSFIRNRDVIESTGNPDYPGKSKLRGTMGKSLFGIPERFYIQCIDDGWIARNHIPWVKNNAMPCSVKDRLQNKWEHVFFFVKNKKYYFDLDSIREKCKTETTPFNVRIREAKLGRGIQKLGDMGWKATDIEKETHNEKGERKQDNTILGNGKIDNTKKGFNDRWKLKNLKRESIGSTNHSMHERRANGEIQFNNPKGKNPGDVWNINVRPFRGAHFATFPLDLPLRILRCGCPKDGTVLDPFFGAGTVGLAAEMMGINWIGIELKEQYVEMAMERIESYRRTKSVNTITV